MQPPSCRRPGSTLFLEGMERVAQTGLSVLPGDFFGGWGAFYGGRLGEFALAELAAEAPLEFGRKLGDFHAGDYQEFAGQHGTRGVVVGKFAGDFAVLALLVPAET